MLWQKWSESLENEVVHSLLHDEQLRHTGYCCAIYTYKAKEICGLQILRLKC